MQEQRMADAGMTATVESLAIHATRRMRQVYGWVDRCGKRGLTVAELRDHTGMHHGMSSAALSRLHKEGKIARLAEKRGRCHVYVTLDHIEDRPIQRQGRTFTPATDAHEAAFAEGEANMRRRVMAVMNRHPQQAGSRFYVDLKNLLERS